MTLHPSSLSDYRAGQGNPPSAGHRAPCNRAMVATALPSHPRGCRFQAICHLCLESCEGPAAGTGRSDVVRRCAFDESVSAESHDSSSANVLSPPLRVSISTITTPFMAPVATMRTPLIDHFFWSGPIDLKRRRTCGGHSITPYVWMVAVPILRTMRGERSYNWRDGGIVKSEPVATTDHLHE